MFAFGLGEHIWGTLDILTTFNMCCILLRLRVKINEKFWFISNQSKDRRFTEMTPIPSYQLLAWFYHLHIQVPASFQNHYLTSRILIIFLGFARQYCSTVPNVEASLPFNQSLMGQSRCLNINRESVLPSLRAVASRSRTMATAWTTAHPQVQPAYSESTSQQLAIGYVIKDTTHY